VHHEIRSSPKAGGYICRDDYHHGVVGAARILCDWVMDYVQGPLQEAWSSHDRGKPEDDNRAVESTFHETRIATTLARRIYA
jgi:hypothetical protein